MLLSAESSASGRTNRLHSSRLVECIEHRDADAASTADAHQAKVVQLCRDETRSGVAYLWKTLSS